MQNNHSSWPYHGLQTIFMLVGNSHNIPIEMKNVNNITNRSDMIVIIELPANCLLLYRYWYVADCIGWRRGRLRSDYHMIKNYKWGLLWVLCEPYLQEDLLSDDEEDASPVESDLFYCRGAPNPLSCVGSWWWSSPFSSTIRPGSPEEEIPVDWEEALIQNSTKTVFLGQQWV